MILAKNISQNQQFGLLTAVSRVKVDGKTRISCKCIFASAKFNIKIKDLFGKRCRKLLEII